MKVLAVNGGPRKNWNTATLLKQAMEGAVSAGAEVELINLYDLDYKGCISCFACKRIGSKSYGNCAVKDDLKPLFEKIQNADALILGSPIYLGMVTGEMRSFLERLIFQYLVYDKNYSNLNQNKIPVGLIYTMNVPEAYLDKVGYKQMFSTTIENPLARTFGETESLFVTDTYQFDDYTKYESSAFNEEEKAKRREEIFPEDCKKAYDMGYRFGKR
ncbi:flavodoxin family protein [Anaerocolumna sp. AGMB13025]|uniref:flavodoxin family protein n=1 Tax=Anaerocolumna sp. AGMB13025 TaxID=3039116 RepID=UPI00241F754E|nr:flavodoxin family protein [Anaerocolumna sp. AGMB13025]WFR59274.1 flavodoxin family protein [Anaerocolumna sp. AGMB13025]